MFLLLQEAIRLLHTGDFFSVFAFPKIKRKWRGRVMATLSLLSSVRKPRLPCIVAE